MNTARKLLFHQNKEVDDSIGTYVTDYVLSAVCFMLATVLVYGILKDHFGNRRNSNCVRFIPWQWPGEELVPVTMSTYSSVCFLFAYGSLAMFSGLSHQYLQQESETRSHDQMRWLVSWRIGAAFAIVSLCAILTLCEQLYQQEMFLRMPDIGRKIYYILLYAGGLAAIAENFIRLSTPGNPYNIENLFLIFMIGILLYGVAVVVLLVRSLFTTRCQRPQQNSVDKDSLQVLSKKLSSTKHQATTRWDLVLHSACPLIMVAGGIFSYLLTPSCSWEHAYNEKGCLLPDTFNHNAVMHLIHAAAVVAVAMGELYAIKRRRTIIIQETNDKHSKLLV